VPGVESLHIFAENDANGASAKAVEARARDAAVTVSIALQFGAGLETIRAALTKDRDGGPATLLGAALDKLERAR
jgi:hypothetical protein